MRRALPAKASGEEFFLHMANGVYRTSVSPIFRGIGGRQFHPYLLDYVKQNPCEALR